jgi:pilus assembly protein CpaB
MKSKAIIPLLLGVIVGLAAIKFGVDALQRAQGEPSETITTVVARSDISESVEVTPDMVTTVQTALSPLVPDGAFTKAEDVVGRVTSKGIPKGTAISPLWLAPPGTPPGLTERIEEGFRAVSVKIDEVSGVAGQIKPGDFVDVIVVMKISRGRETETISRIILQRIKVLAVGQNLGDPRGKAGPQKLARSVTLLVQDAEVPKLHLAQTQGKVTLAMRGSDDQLMADTGHASTGEWLNPRPPQAEDDSTPEATPLAGLFSQVAEPDAPKEKETFAVTVVNGPLRAQGTSPVQQVIYENRDSMKVINVGTGRTGRPQPAGPDSAESILRPPRKSGPDMYEERFPDRDGSRSDWTRQPQDREMPEE